MHYFLNSLTSNMCFETFCLMAIIVIIILSVTEDVNIEYFLEWGHNKLQTEGGKHAPLPRRKPFLPSPITWAIRSLCLFSFSCSGEYRSCPNPRGWIKHMKDGRLEREKVWRLYRVVKGNWWKVFCWWVSKNSIYYRAVWDLRLLRSYLISY